MSHAERNYKYLIKHRIIYRCVPWSDEPTETYEWGWYYDQGTHQCYTLFASRAKINTYKSLKWHLYVLWFLNPTLDQEAFNALADMICEKSNGFLTFNVSKRVVESMVLDVSLMDLEKPPPNKLRKVIFRDYSGLEMRQKLSIVGKLIGRSKLSENEIYDAMLMVYDNNEKITIAKLAGFLGCSTRTIYRNMSNELKKEKELLNQQL